MHKKTFVVHSHAQIVTNNFIRCNTLHGLYVKTNILDAELLTPKIRKNVQMTSAILKNIMYDYMKIMSLILLIYAILCPTSFHILYCKMREYFSGMGIKYRLIINNEPINDL